MMTQATVPELGDIVINEILAHSHAAGADWIELYNTTNRPINIGSWFLSDDQGNLTKYQIKEGTSIPAYGYKFSMSTSTLIIPTTQAVTCRLR